LTKSWPSIVPINQILSGHNRILMRPRALLLDGDGVIWLEGQAIPGAVQALNEIRAMGVRLILVTNNSSKTRDQYLKVIERIGLVGFTRDDVFSSGFACRCCLENMGISRVYVVGFPSLCQEIEEAGITVMSGRLTPEQESKGIEAMVVSMSPYLRYEDFEYYIWVYRKFRPKLIGTNPDPTWPVSDRVALPGSGSVVRMFECALSASATVVGKPGSIMFDAVLKFLGCKADQVIMVGDRIMTDIKFASRHGARSILVLTGVDTMKDVEEADEMDKPTWVLRDLVEAAELLRNMAPA
jgi:4-nitrophenyl phosphatase